MLLDMPASPETKRARRNVHRLSTLWVALIVVLTSLPILKVGEVQFLEFLQAGRLLVVVLLGACAGFTFPARGIWRDYGPMYLALLGAYLGSGLLSLRLNSYPPPETSLLKQPLLISLSRTAEILLATYFTLALVDTFQRNRRLLRIALDLYCIIGGASALLSMASVILVKTSGVYLYFVYGEDARVRGFFNEAGPYGVYLVSVILALFLRAHLFPRGLLWVRRVFLAAVLAAFYQSASKAGFLAVLGICGIVGLLAARARQRIVVLAGLAVFGTLTWITLQEQFANYWRDYSVFEELVISRSDDPSLIMGRIAGTIIVPRMIAQHPWLGIGIGNYPLMRNNPDYLQDLPVVTEWDLPGLGLVGSAAEFGIPLTIALLLILLRPLIQARRRLSPLIVLAVAAFQPVAALAGVNLNFFYPWFITALALSVLPEVSPAPRTTRRSRRLIPRRTAAVG